MIENPLVSVIIACYNAEPYIDDCLNSIVTQTYKHLEILICDDASLDGSFYKLKEWERKDSRITILRNENNCYAATTRNKCIKASHGDYMLIQDIDDISKPERVEILLDELNKNPTISIISSSVEAFDDHPQNIIKTFGRRNMFFPTKYDFLKGQPFSHPASLISRTCIDAVHGYRIAPETKRCQDYDMFMRMYAKGFKAMVIPTPLYLYRLDDANYRRRTMKARFGEYKIRVRCFKEMGLMPWAYPFTLKPFLAHILQYIKNFFR